MVTRAIAELYREVYNDAYDLGIEEYVAITPIIRLRNDVSVAQTLTFEFNRQNKQHTYWNMSSLTKKKVLLRRDNHLPLPKPKRYRPDILYGSQLDPFLLNS